MNEICQLMQLGINFLYSNEDYIYDRIRSGLKPVKNTNESMNLLSK